MERRSLRPPSLRFLGENTCILIYFGWLCMHGIFKNWKNSMGNEIFRAWHVMRHEHQAN